MCRHKKQNSDRDERTWTTRIWDALLAHRDPANQIRWIEQVSTLGASSAAHRNMQMETANYALKDYTKYDKQGKHSNTRDALVGPFSGLLVLPT